MGVDRKIIYLYMFTNNRYRISSTTKLNHLIVKKVVLVEVKKVILDFENDVPIFSLIIIMVE